MQREPGLPAVGSRVAQVAVEARSPHLHGPLHRSGMGAGLPDFVVVNLSDLDKHFEAGAEVCLECIKSKVLSVSGRDARLPLKVRSAAVDAAG